MSATVSDSGPSIAELLNTMRIAPVGTDDTYYAVTLSADDDGQMFFDIQTIWAGFADEDRRIELREARLVYGSRMAKLWTELGEPPLFVRTEIELQAFLFVGGHGLLEPQLAKSCVPDWLAAQPSYAVGFFGFRSPELFEKGAFRRAPTPKLRMKVLNRDGRRCRICGRCPDDNVDIELHIHHIRPWGFGGLSYIGNLITLCHTCHNGIDPHFDPTLFSYLRGKSEDCPKEKFSREVANYRKAILASSGTSISSKND